MTYDDQPIEKKCGNCGAKEGELHQSGCDMERCPFCGGQLISCGCIYKMCGFPGYKGMNEIAKECGSHEEFVRYMQKNQDVNDSGLPEEIYENGPTDEMYEKFDKLLEEKGRFPYFRYPNLCKMCGMTWPELFMVPDEQWEKYIEPGMRREVICRGCYDRIVELTNLRSGK